jgi:hypothetical protein
MKRRSKRLQWDYDPGLLAKEDSNFVGLVNQGGTCYMNSLIQQLFHIPALSDGLLKIEGGPAGASAAPADGDEEPDSARVVVHDPNKTNADDHDTLLFQLQVMFAYLRLSQKRYYDTLPFCRAFKDYDGMPISLTEQKDINEFAGNVLFDQLIFHFGEIMLFFVQVLLIRPFCRANFTSMYRDVIRQAGKQ